MNDEHRCGTCGLPDGPDYGDPHVCPPGFLTSSQPGFREPNPPTYGPPISECCKAPTTPRVAESLDDLAVGMVVVGRARGHWYEPIEIMVMSATRVWFDSFQTAEDGQVVILADPPAPPAPDWLVPADKMEALREAINHFGDADAKGTRWFRLVDAASAVLDAATEVER